MKEFSGKEHIEAFAGKYKFYVREVKIADLKPHPKNPRKITQAAKHGLRENLKTLGQIDLIIVNHDMTVLCGHQRYYIMKEDGHETINAFVADRQLDAEDEQALLVRHNLHIGDWDTEVLKFFDREDLLNFGFRQQFVQNLFFEVDRKELFPAQKDPEYPVVAEFNEKYNYVVIVAPTNVDYIALCDSLDVKPRVSCYKEPKHFGIGRVLMFNQVADKLGIASDVVDEDDLKAKLEELESEDGQE